MKKPGISMLLPVYNEERMLFHSLRSTIEFVDQVVVVDGSPFGPSTDRTGDILAFFSRQYPDKIDYLSGTFRLENGGWDEGAQRNLGLAKVDGDYLMPHCGDMVYGFEDMRKMVEAITMFPHRRIAYCPFIEFWIDTQHIRLYRGFAMEGGFVAPAISDINFVSMELVVEYRGGPHLVLNEWSVTDMLYVPSAFRYHYGWILGFDTQVRKQYRRMKMGAWANSPDLDLQHEPDEVIVKWAINHVLDYPKMGCNFDYYGEVPTKDCLTYLDNKDETLAFYEEKYGEGFWHD